MGRWAGPIFGNWTKKGASGQDLAPFVRQQLGRLAEFMRLGQIKTHARKYRLDDGTIVLLGANLNGSIPILTAQVSSVPTTSGEPRVSISIESGLIRLPWAGETEATAADLYPLNAQQSQAGLVRDQLLDEINADGYFTYRNYAEGTFFDSESLPAEAWPSWQAMSAGKRLYELTGKLHYAIQIKTRGLKFPGGGLYVDGFTGWVLGRRLENAIRETVHDSYILYTVELGTYFLIHFTVDGNINARLLRMSSVYLLTLEEVQEQIIRLGAAEGSATYQRYEGYVLACLDFAGSWASIGNYSAVEGSSFAYGWKPTWDGSRISIATNVAGGQQSGSPGIALPHNAYLWTATITGGSIEAYPVASVSEMRHKEWTPRMEPGLDVQIDLIWTPDLLSLIESDYWFAHTTASAYVTLIDVEDVPIYCYYNHNNNLVLVDYSFDGSATKTEDDTELDWRNGLSGCFPEGLDGTWQEKTGGWLGKFYLEEVVSDSDTNMYVDSSLLGDAFEGSVGTITGTGKRTRYRIVGSNENLCWSSCRYVNGSTSMPCIHSSTFDRWCGSPRSTIPWFDGDGCNPINPTGFAVVAHYEALNTNDSWIGNVNTDCRPAIVIPAGNAESVYLLSSVEEYSSDTIHSTLYLNGVSRIVGPGASYIHKYTSPVDWAPCQTGGCGTGSAPSHTTKYPTYSNIVDRLYADKFGVQSFENMESVTDFPESSYSLFVVSITNPIYIGWFLGIAGVEGPKFYQQHPGGDDFGDFNSNVGIEWENIQFKMFAGWA